MQNYVQNYVLGFFLRNCTEAVYQSFHYAESSNPGTQYASPVRFLISFISVLQLSAHMCDACFVKLMSKYFVLGGNACKWHRIFHFIVHMFVAM